MRILIIEDEKKTSAFLRKGLTEAGFIADIAENGADGLLNVLSLEYDLVILDAMLPKKDGWSVLSELRRQGRSMPGAGRRNDGCFHHAARARAAREHRRGGASGANLRGRELGALTQRPDHRLEI
jgi:CheY-like chemotaxis protein